MRGYGTVWGIGKGLAARRVLRYLAASLDVNGEFVLGVGPVGRYVVAELEFEAGVRCAVAEGYPLATAH